MRLLVKKIKKRYIPLFIIGFVIFALAAPFLFRGPLLVVTDAPFIHLYGQQRQRSQSLRASRELFRRVVPVRVDDLAGPDLIALVVERASRRPRAVIFPYRYLEAARVYKERRPNVAVLVIGGAATRRENGDIYAQGDSYAQGGVSEDEPAIVFVRTDTHLDLFRAGLSAAFIAGGNRVLFISERDLEEELRQPFKEGLYAQDFTGETDFRNIFAHISPITGIGCVVVSGAASRYIERNLHIPIILFSWVNPALTPRTVKIIFNDSPWALATKAFRAARPFFTSGGEIFIPSQPTVLQNRIEDRDDFLILQSLVKENLSNN